MDFTSYYRHGGATKPPLLYPVRNDGRFKKGFHHHHQDLTSNQLSDDPKRLSTSLLQHLLEKGILDRSSPLSGDSDPSDSQPLTSNTLVGVHKSMEFKFPEINGWLSNSSLVHLFLGSLSKHLLKKSIPCLENSEGNCGVSLLQVIL